MRDSLRALASYALDSIEARGGPHVYMARLESGDPDAALLASELEDRAAALGATMADVIAALRSEGIRRGRLPVVSAH